MVYEIFWDLIAPYAVELNQPSLITARPIPISLNGKLKKVGINILACEGADVPRRVTVALNGVDIATTLDFMPSSFAYYYEFLFNTPVVIGDYITFYYTTSDSDYTKTVLETFADFEVSP